MEKIQEALAKARSSRAAIEPRAPMAVPGATATADWSALEPFVPDPAQLMREHILAGGGAGGGSVVMAFDVMRTRLLQVQRDNGWRRIGITSPGPNCGKTTICLNLALGLARQAEQSVILYETDLRRPSMAKKLGLTRAGGMGGFFAGTEGFETRARRLGTNLAVLCGEQPTAGSAEILHGGAVHEVLSGVEARYAPTVELFDLPPMQAGDDVMAIAPKLDAVLLVAAAGQTSIKEIDHCERELASQTNVMGVVVNKCQFLPKDESYGSYYGYR
ncbi:CpsD/CapB family tyrosine-protein kinase [Frigidibacter sp. MR17.24]|uniref:CpsD/CapB family tyrosine-protein kinase n=1 Tax=Frigidibacter sp. MR17.24 TaxID=3127345 RepID=UPI003012ECF8